MSRQYFIDVSSADKDAICFTAWSKLPNTGMKTKFLPVIEATPAALHADEMWELLVTASAVLSVVDQPGLAEKINVLLNKIEGKK